MLFGNMKEGVDTIDVDGMDAQVFRAMLSFIYSDSLPPEMEDEKGDPDVMWKPLLIAADRYDLGRLRLMCEEKLAQYLDVSTVCTMLALAEQHNCHGLKGACLEFLNSPRNLQKVMAMDGLDSLAACCPSVLKDLIAELASPKQDKLVLVSSYSYVKHVFQKCCPSVLKDFIAKLASLIYAR
jgi:speckle-type POZ protein